MIQQKLPATAAKMNAAFPSPAQKRWPKMENAALGISTARASVTLIALATYGLLTSLMQVSRQTAQKTMLKRAFAVT